MSSLIIPIFIPNQGCRSQCVFCNQRAATGAKLDDEEFGQTVRKWISFKKKSTNPDQIQIAFYGGSFTSLPVEEQTRLLSMTLPFTSEKIVGSIRVSARPDSFSGDTLERLKRFGVKTVELGVQSLDPHTLHLSGRNHGPGVVWQTASRLKSSGFETGIQLMPGLPGDTREKFLKTVEDTVKIKPDFTRIYPTLVIRNTVLEREYKAGRFKPLQLEEAVEWAAQGVSLLEGANIKVIRLGLQSNEYIQLGKGVVAGPFHPAFGQLVKSRRALEKMLSMFRDFQQDPTHRESLGKNRGVIFYVPPRELSDYRGQKNGNLVKLKEIFSREFNILPVANNKVILPSEPGLSLMRVT